MPCSQRDYGYFSEFLFRVPDKKTAAILQTKCAEAKMSEKWFSELRMMLAYAAFGFAVAVSLQDAHALYIEQKYAAPLENADHGSPTSSDYFFISLDNISLDNIAISRPLQSLDPKMGSRPGPANGVPALNGQIQNKPSLEPGPSILAEQGAYIDRFIIDFVKTVARDNEIGISAIDRNVRAAAYSFYDGAAYQSAPGFSSVPENADGVNSDRQQEIEHTQFRIMLSWLLRSLNDGSFFMYFAPSCIVILGLKGLVEKFVKSH